jgi:hypothetical protein
VTPHRDSRGRGTLILDRRLGKLGRLRIASGTNDPDEFRALNVMLTRLRKERRWELLSLLYPPPHQARGVITPLELSDALWRGDLSTLPTADDLRALGPMVERWASGADIAEATREHYRYLLTQFVGRYPEARLGAVPALLTAEQAQAVGTGKRPNFNQLLWAMRSFFAGTLGDDHRLTKAVRAIAHLKESPREGNPQTPDEIKALAVRLPVGRVAEVWALCLTGMRSGEYFTKHGAQWSIATDRIRILGSKTDAARREIPLVYPVARPAVGYKRFHDVLADVSDEMLVPTDLRKTAQRWWEDAGIPDWRIELYAGHEKGRRALERVYRKPRNMTSLLVEDGERMRAWLGEPPRLGLQVVGA